MIKRKPSLYNDCLTTDFVKKTSLSPSVYSWSVYKVKLHTDEFCQFRDSFTVTYNVTQRYVRPIQNKIMSLKFMTS